MPHVRLPAADVTARMFTAIVCVSPSAIPPGKPGIGSDLDAAVAQIGAVGLVVTSIVSNTAGYT
jgi:hypothetical protein